MHTFAIVQDLTRSIEKPIRIRICASFASRLQGLMFQRDLARDQGVLLVGARDTRLDSGIHMLFVPFDLAVFWINNDMRVVDKVLAKAWHPVYIPSRPARYVLELHSDLLSSYEIGDKVQIIDA